MSQSWLQLDGTNIIGWQQGKAAPEGAVIADAALLSAYRDARAAMQAIAQPGHPQWVDGQVVIPPDTRPLFRITCDRAPHPQLGVPVFDADGVDAVTVTIERMADEETVDTSFTTPLILSSATRTWSLNFVEGVATKVFRAKQSGRYDVESSHSFRLVAPFTLVAAE